MKGAAMPRGLRLLSAALLTCMVAIPASGEELKPGDKAPDFSMVGSDGKTYTLAGLKGKTVVLAWFPKAFTGG
jgi:peroxiredoxin Q/BCP